MKDYSHVVIKFNKEDIELFGRITAELCDEKDLYYSDIVESIHGDVSYKIHADLFYGFKAHVSEKDVQDYIQTINLKEIKLGKLFTLLGWKNQYQVLCVEILDKDLQLEKIHNDFKQFDHEPKVQYPDFKPHITLAFVNSDYKIKNNVAFPESLQIKEIKFIKE